ncbi:MAG: hypothetical protein EOO90_03675 [Pedobacter sp.]|nr:MAG: hypothetical protein EOO90_03675 [Pedobacter sp.]
MKELFDRVYELRIHLICWGLWIAYEVATTAYIRGNFSPLHFYLFFYGLNIGLFYLHGKLVLPLAMASGINWLWMVPLGLALELLGYALVSMGLNVLMGKLGSSVTPLVVDVRFFVNVLWRAVLFILFSTGYYFLVTALKRRKLATDRMMEIERLNSQLLRSERDYLRSQVNPHLLFNTLSFVKFAAKTDRAQAEEAIQHLAALMRFSLDKSENGLVDLEQEIVQVQHLIRLNELRFGGKVFVELKSDLAGRCVQVIPVMLLTLVENVFKHGNVRSQLKPARILVLFAEKSLKVQTVNLANDAGMLLGNNGFGTGLVNLKERLEAAYRDNYQLQYGLVDGIFQVDLQIDFGAGWELAAETDNSD